MKSSLLVTSLIATQFPKWSHLPVEPVLPGGHDHHTFRLGPSLLVRLPSSSAYAPQVPKEQKWLPTLSEHLSLQIPRPRGLGHPSELFPSPFSIYDWIEGKSLTPPLSHTLQLDTLYALAQFLKELHAIDPSGGPLPGPHNFFRGAELSLYDGETRKALEVLKGPEKNRLETLWEEALSSKWEQCPVWVHGDLSLGNILSFNGKVSAVIDFGCLGVGDPACDLALCWTHFSSENRHTFQSLLPLDPSTWIRAKGWALWKALITSNRANLCSL